MNLVCHLNVKDNPLQTIIVSPEFGSWIFSNIVYTGAYIHMNFYGPLCHIFMSYMYMHIQSMRIMLFNELLNVH